MIVALVLFAAVAPAPIVHTDAGRVRGEALPGGGGVFRGIRFARPPVGPLRWRAPAAPRRWRGVMPAVASRNACPQPVYGVWNRAASEQGNEDCLFLDVRTPRIGGRLPVLVWIHGGGNRGGAGSGTVESRITDGGIVLVSVQYRLGALGFLSHPALTREQGSSGNYGLMDQQAALRWVHANIARLGGDPQRVTIAGESAGAQDVGLHLLAPGSRGLFAGAIAQSGTPGFGVPPRSRAENESLGRDIAVRAGARAQNAAALRRLPVSAILAAQEAAEVPWVDSQSFVWLQAVVDGRVLTEPPAASLAHGRFARVPLLIGVNAQEFTGYGGWNLPPVIAREFGANAPAVERAYALPHPRLGDAAMQLGTDLVFRCPTITVSNRIATAGVPVWQYQFDHAAPGGTVAHASELRYVFGPSRPGEPPLQRYWLNFVRSGDPNVAGLPVWRRYTPRGRAYLSFEPSGRAEARANLRGPICDHRSLP